MNFPPFAPMIWLIGLWFVIFIGFFLLKGDPNTSTLIPFKVLPFSFFMMAIHMFLTDLGMYLHNYRSQNDKYGVFPKWVLWIIGIAGFLFFVVSILVFFRS